MYFDRREVKERPFALLVMPALIFVFVALTTWKAGYEGARLLNSAILYWATWHFVAQNWGILRIYQRKSGEPETSLALKLERPLLLLPCRPTPVALTMDLRVRCLIMSIVLFDQAF